ncbi:MAG: glutathione synthase [Deltaproteobacteria bacterium]|nr:glutathione synthase [Deltaproteobacteria bacterium]
MPPDPLRLAFVMNPIQSLDIDADTTFALMLEAQERGHRIFCVDPADLTVEGGHPSARLQEVTLQRVQGDHVSLGECHERVLDDWADVVFQRVDPPVDDDYVRATQILTLCRRARVLNRPASILAANEKLYALQFADLMAETLVTRHIPDLVAFLASLGGEMIVKPLEGKGGEGIFHVRSDDRNLFSILEQSTRFGERWTMAQRYLPDVRKGDKRILLLEGEALGALLRVPAEDEIRANLHVGGRAEAAILDEDDRRIVERLAPRLREDGFFFVGIDVIGGKLTEINVTSPTGIQEAQRLSGEPLATRVLEAVEALVHP